MGAWEWLKPLPLRQRIAVDRVGHEVRYAVQNVAVSN